MSLFSAFSVSASGMAAQRARAELLVENLANAETTRTPEGGPYRRKDAVFAPAASRHPSPIASFEIALCQRRRRGGRNQSWTRAIPKGAICPAIRTPTRTVTSAFPRINPAEDMVDLMGASRGYQANVAAISRGQRHDSMRSIDLVQVEHGVNYRHRPFLPIRHPAFAAIASPIDIARRGRCRRKQRFQIVLARRDRAAWSRLQQRRQSEPWNSFLSGDGEELHTVVLATQRADWHSTCSCRCATRWFRLIRKSCGCRCSIADPSDPWINSKTLRELSRCVRCQHRLAGRMLVVRPVCIGFSQWQREAGFPPAVHRPGRRKTPRRGAEAEGKRRRVPALAKTARPSWFPPAKRGRAAPATGRGGLPKSGRIGFEMFDKTNFGVTDFAEHVNYRRALEGELERSVMSLAEVEQARVHLTFPKESVFLEARQPAKASVLVRLATGRAASPQNVMARLPPDGQRGGRTGAGSGFGGGHARQSAQPAAQGRRSTMDWSLRSQSRIPRRWSRKDLLAKIRPRSNPAGRGPISRRGLGRVRFHQRRTERRDVRPGPIGDGELAEDAKTSRRSTPSRPAFREPPPICRGLRPRRRRRLRRVAAHRRDQLSVQPHGATGHAAARRIEASVGLAAAGSGRPLGRQGAATCSRYLVPPSAGKAESHPRSGGRGDRLQGRAGRPTDRRDLPFESTLHTEPPQPYRIARRLRPPRRECRFLAMAAHTEGNGRGGRRCTVVGRAGGGGSAPHAPAEAGAAASQAALPAGAAAAPACDGRVRARRRSRRRLADRPICRRAWKPRPWMPSSCPRQLQEEGRAHQVSARESEERPARAGPDLRTWLNEKA